VIIAVVPMILKIMTREQDTAQTDGLGTLRVLESLRILLENFAVGS